MGTDGWQPEMILRPLRPDELEVLTGAIASPLEPPSTSAPPTRPPHAEASANTVAPHSELPRRTAYPSSARDRVRTQTDVVGRIGSPRQWPQSPGSVTLAWQGALAEAVGFHQGIADRHGI